MTRLPSKLLRLIPKSTHLLSLKLADLSLSALLPCGHVARALIDKALALFPSMDDFDFFSSEDDNLLDLDYLHRPHTRCRLPFLEERDQNANETLYLVSYRWWTEAQTDSNHIEGTLFTAFSHDDNDSEIVLRLRKEENGGDGAHVSYGCEYALVPETLWLLALKWHNDSKEAVDDVGSHFFAEDNFQDVFPIQIRISVSWETNSLIVKICLKDNVVSFYQEACNIFSPNSELLHIWDFSGQTTQILSNDRINLSNDSPGQPGEEILLELRVHGFLRRNNRGKMSDEMVESSEMEGFFCSDSLKTNGSSDNVKSFSTIVNSSGSCSSSYRRAGSLGLRGLQNLGNTCFMNSAIQCLTHSPKLVDYFLRAYRKEINYDNPLRMKGELALAFGDLLRKLWTPGTTPVTPRMFKLKLADFAPQFSGYNQHDSQEFLAFLLDGLHEDLNRVKCKPYIEAKDAEERPDEEVAEEYWQYHLARNDSIIVDVCQGQYRSTLVCPLCKKKSVTFDPFMYLSLPLPSTTMRTMTLTVLSSYGPTLPTPFTITVPKYGRLKDLIEALSSACSLKNDETLLVAEIFKNQICRFLEEPSDSLVLIRDDDRLVAYRLPKDCEEFPLVVFTHEREEKSYGFERATSNWKIFGIPLVGRLSDVSNGFDVCKLFLKLLNPFLMSIEDVLNDYDDAENIANEGSAMEDDSSPMVSEHNTDSDSERSGDPQFSMSFQLYLKSNIGSTEIKMNEPIVISGSTKSLDVNVFWSDESIEKYDTCLLSLLPEVFKPQIFTRRPQETVSLYKCLEAFLKEEPLGPDDMWYCPSCKNPRQASKKLDLWRLPEILVIHLKRFSYSRFLKNKLETFVDFPIDDLDLTNYISHMNGQLSNRYVLYAISNHYGGMGSGHYTAFVDHGHGRWHEFDDGSVYPVSEDNIKTSAAYVLFYRRVPDV